MKSYKLTIATPEALPTVLEEIEKIQRAWGEPADKSAESRAILAEVVAEIHIQLEGSDAIRIVCRQYGRRCAIHVYSRGKALILETKHTRYRDFGERVQQSYRLAVNHVAINAEYSSKASFRYGSYAVLLGILFGVLVNIISGGCDPNSRFVTDFIVPVEQLFTNGMQLIAAPVSFLCFISTILTLNDSLNRDFNVRSVVTSMMTTSVFALAIGFILPNLAMKMGLGYSLSTLYNLENGIALQLTLKDFILSMMPSSLLQAFIDSNPLPLILLATAFGLAASRPGKYHRPIFHFFENAKDLICSVLDIVYFFLPLAAFGAAADIVISMGIKAIKPYIVLLILCFIALIIILLLYIVDLLLNGLNPKAICKILRVTLKENLKIGSNQTAIPYNVRKLNEKFGIPVKYLKNILTLGAKENMDANCALLGLFTMVVVLSSGIDLTLMQGFFLVLVVIFLSLGSPNLPGSLLLGILIIFTYLGIDSSLLCSYILMEAVLSKSTAFINTVGDLTVAITDAKKSDLISRNLEEISLKK